MVRKFLFTPHLCYFDPAIRTFITKVKAMVQKTNPCLCTEDSVQNVTDVDPNLKRLILELVEGKLIKKNIHTFGSGISHIRMYVTLPKYGDMYISFYGNEEIVSLLNE